MNGLYLVTDQSLTLGRPLDHVVASAVAGGVRYVQLRAKDATTRTFVEEAQRLKALLAPLGVPLIINDRVDVALAVGADGVHLGQDDMPYPTARAVLGPDAIIGLSVETPADVAAAEPLDVDYLGVSPIFPTPTKRDTKGSWGLDGLAQVRRSSRHPLVAIGGVNADNIADMAAAGADAVAVVSAICSAPDPRSAAERLVARFTTAVARRQSAEALPRAAAEPGSAEALPRAAAEPGSAEALK